MVKQTRLTVKFICTLSVLLTLRHVGHKFHAEVNVFLNQNINIVQDRTTIFKILLLPKLTQQLT